MLRKIIVTGFLVVVLFALVTPAEVYAQKPNKTQMQLLQDAIDEVSIGNRNTNEVRKAINLLQVVLRQFPDYKKDEYRKSPQTKLGKLHLAVKDYGAFLEAADDVKNKRSTVANSMAIANSGKAFLTAIESLSGVTKMNQIQGNTVSALVQIGTLLVNAAQDRVAEIEFTYLWTNDRRLERPEYMDLGRAMVKAGIGPNTIAQTFEALDILKAIR